MKNTIKYFVIVSMLTLFGCTKNEPTIAPTITATCPVDALSAFENMYNPMNNATFPESLSGYSSSIIHEYTFSVSSAATICSIGYQSQTALATSTYQIDIYDTVSSTVVASITSTFLSSQTSYASLSVPLTLTAGRSYIIKRYSPATAANPNGAGRCVSNSILNGNNVVFPKTNGILTITGSKFYTQTLNGIVSAGANSGLPFIKIVFSN